MIIINEKKVAFIHIPKNGGTSIRAYFNTINKGAINEFEYQIFVHKKERYDMNHLTLDLLNKNFKTTFDLIKQYNSFCILRDPRERFYSSINQYFRFQKNKMIDECSEKELNEEISIIISKLKELKGKNFPANFIHFQPQVDFVMLDNKIVIKNIFYLDDTASIEKFVKSNISEDFVMQKKNDTVFIKNKISAKTLRFLYKVFSSAGLRFSDSQISFIKSKLFRNKNVMLDKIEDKSKIDGFIDDYYSKDLKLIESL